MSGTDPKPISNPAFFAKRVLKCPPKVQLRSVAGSKNRALTPIAHKGFTYLGVMIIVMIMGFGLAAFGTIYSQTARRDKEAAEAFAHNIALPAGARLRQVRVVRDYGMFDRREAPQFYPDAKGAATVHA